MMKATMLLAAVLLLALTHHAAASPHVSGIKANYRNGQVFVTWNNVATTGTTYTVYKYGFHIGAAELPLAQKLGTVGDNSSENTRYSNLVGTTTTYVVKNGDPPLAATKGLFVTTCTDAASYFYAVTVTQGGTEYTDFADGANTLASPVTEGFADPQPVRQMPAFTSGPNSVTLYTQFLTAVSQPAYPQMTNAGSFPVNFAISAPLAAGAGPHPLIVRLHVGNGSYLDRIDETLPANTWQLALDDWLPNLDGRTAWFGYHTDYDITSNSNVPPGPGAIVHGYTLARVMFTLDWTIANFSIDDARVYLAGGSMGASGGLIVAMMYPERFAACDFSVPKVNFAELTDWQPTYDFAPLTPKRLETDRRWGTVATDLFTDVDNPTAPGTALHIYEITNANAMAVINHERGVPVIFAVNGKNDEVVGWSEKIPFYASMNANQLGGNYYWDLRHHTGGPKTWDHWEPDLLRYRTTLSWPAFSNCSIDDAAVDGIAAPVTGSKNGFLDWNETIVDTPSEWRDSLKYRSGLTWSGAPATPNATVCTADVTLRRLQNFAPPAGCTIKWRLYKGGGVIDGGSMPYAGGLVTIPAVTIHQAGVFLRVWWVPGFDDGDGPGLE